MYQTSNYYLATHGRVAACGPFHWQKSDNANVRITKKSPTFWSNRKRQIHCFSTGRGTTAFISTTTTAETATTTGGSIDIFVHQYHRGTMTRSSASLSLGNIIQAFEGLSSLSSPHCQYYRRQWWRQYFTTASRAKAWRQCPFAVTTWSCKNNQFFVFFCESHIYLMWNAVSNEMLLIIKWGQIIAKTYLSDILFTQECFNHRVEGLHQHLRCAALSVSFWRYQIRANPQKCYCCYTHVYRDSIMFTSALFLLLLLLVK